MPAGGGRIAAVSGLEFVMDGTQSCRNPAGLNAGIAKAMAATEGPILVAVDFSSAAAAALIWACGYADSVGAPLEILRVIHDPGDAPGTYKQSGNDPLEPISDVAKRKLDNFVAEVVRDRHHQTRLEDARSLCVEGLPVPTILAVAKRHGARLLVLGHRRRNGVARLIRGSTSQQIAGRAAFPVTIVKADNR